METGKFFSKETSIYYNQFKVEQVKDKKNVFLCLIYFRQFNPFLARYLLIKSWYLFIWIITAMIHEFVMNNVMRKCLSNLFLFLPKSLLFNFVALKEHGMTRDEFHHQTWSSWMNKESMETIMLPWFVPWLNRKKTIRERKNNEN